MPAFYEAPVGEFLATDVDQIVGRLSRITDQGIAEVSSNQLSAWRIQIPLLRSALRGAILATGHLLLEYPIPRRGKRIDAIVLTGSLILVIEFKCGADDYLRDAKNQVEDYCLDLRDFHQESRDCILVPILVATRASAITPPLEAPSDSVSPVWLSNADSLGETLDLATRRYQSYLKGEISPVGWNHSAYLPTPTIIEAARSLYEGQNVREISRSHAGAENLTLTSEAVSEAVHTAKNNDQKIICFVTGVPGAGKTLAGLNVIHSRQFEEGVLGVFLSGNGPLVRVLCEALARDCSRKSQPSMGESRRHVSTFVQNVHRFIDAYFGTSSPPQDRLVVFDEAQRAWNAHQSNLKFKRNVSEPEIMLDIMDRHRGWAVIVALVGSGQEINTGEAGLREWGRALTERFSHWKIFISGELAKPRSLDGEGLFAEVPASCDITEKPALQLKVSQRSYKAQNISDFVSHVLSMHIYAAREVLLASIDFPLVLTRELPIAKQWLRDRQRGTRRIGLVASSGGRRLRAHGLDVRTELDVENWFLNDSSDVRSSFYLETPATEFGIQGLELDWTALCWDLDLVPLPGGWDVQAFKGTNWQKVHDPVRRQFVINKYRVLLTRAREGMIIWVPRGDSCDRTRPLSQYDQIATYLMECGVPAI